MKKSVLLLAIIPILLLSCVARLETVKEGYEDAPICCHAFTDFDYEMIKLGDRKKFWIKTDSRAFIFEGGKSFFKAFELPVYEEPYEIIVKSYFVGDRPQTFYIFSPLVILLDKNFKIIYKIKGGSFKNIKSFMNFKRGLIGEIPVTKEDSEGRYMIILTTEELLKKTTGITVPLMVPIIFPGIVGAIPIGWDYIEVPHSPVGKITVELKSLDN